MNDIGWLVSRTGLRTPVGFENGVFKIDIERKIIFPDYRYNYSKYQTDNLEFKKKIGEEFFGDKKFFYYSSHDFLELFIRKCDGKTHKEIKKIAEDYKSKRENAKNRSGWKELKERFGGFVIGLDSEVDVYENGFSVRVLFRSDSTFNGKGMFLENNKKDFLRWLLLEISNSSKIVKKIGDVRFYKPVEIINLRAPEVEVKFEVKRDVMKGA